MQVLSARYHSLSRVRVYSRVMLTAAECLLCQTKKRVWPARLVSMLCRKLSPRNSRIPHAHKTRVLSEIGVADAAFESVRGYFTTETAK